MKDATAYRFVNDRNMRDQIETAVGRPEVLSAVTSTGLLTALADLTNLATLSRIEGHGLLSFKIAFKDGSYVIIRADVDHANGTYEPNSARTQPGQVVPATIESVGSPGHGAIKTISCGGSGAAKICIVKWETY